MKSIELWRALLLAAVLIGAGACSRVADDPGALGSEVWYTGDDPMVSIGDIGGAEAFVFSEVAGVRLMADSRVAVADRSSGTIRIFGLDGRHVRTFGGVGEGPGEFQYMSSILYRAPDTVVAYDSNARRLTVFHDSGSLASTITLQATDGRPEVYMGTASSGLHAAAWIARGPRDPSVSTPDPIQIGVFDREGQLLHRVHSGPGMRRLLGPPLPFSPHFLAVMLGDSLYVTDGVGGSVQVVGLSPGPTRTLGIDIEPQSPDEAWRRLAVGMDSARATMFPDVSGHPAADSIPAISEMISDDRGRVWLKRYDAATDSHWLDRTRTGGEWLVMTPGGEKIASFVGPDGFRVMDVREGRVAGVAVDALGVERVQVFEVLGGTPGT